MTTIEAARDIPTESTSKLTLLPLTALVVGSMIAGGVFNLPLDLSRGALVIGVGMLMLAFVYQRLAVRRPELDAGPRAYTKAGWDALACER